MSAMSERMGNDKDAWGDKKRTPKTSFGDLQSGVSMNDTKNEDKSLKID